MIAWLVTSVVLASIVVMFVTPISPASAAAASDRAKKTLACLEAADTQQTNAASCVGMIATACMNAGKNDAGVTDTTCAAKELSFWQGLLDKAWTEAKPLIARYPEIKGPQLEAQKLWLQYRDKSCAIADKVDPGMMPGGSARCRMEETAARAVAVRAIVAALSEH